MKLLPPRRATACLTLLMLFLTPVFLSAQAAPAAPKLQAWVEKSNQNAKIVNEVVARFGPEGAGQLGIEGLDEQIVDLKPNVVERGRAAAREVLAELKKRHAAETDPLVKQDLDILIQATDDTIRNADINKKYYVPYNNVTRLVFGGLRALLDDQIAPERRKAAVVAGEHAEAKVNEVTIRGPDGKRMKVDERHAERIERAIFERERGRR